MGTPSRFFCRSSRWVRARLAARQVLADGIVEPAIYMVPPFVALLLGLPRPTYLGSLAAWMGWTVGLAVAWWLESGEMAIGGPALYGLLAAAAPHALGTTVRSVLKQRRAT